MRSIGTRGPWLTMTVTPLRHRHTVRYIARLILGKTPGNGLLCPACRSRGQGSHWQNPLWLGPIFGPICIYSDPVRATFSFFMHENPRHSFSHPFWASFSLWDLYLSLNKIPLTSFTLGCRWPSFIMVTRQESQGTETLWHISKPDKSLSWAEEGSG